MRLIVTEKNNSAKKIAEALEHTAPTALTKPSKSPSTPGPTPKANEHMTVGLKGHVLGPAFPEGYSNWQKTDLHDLIDAELIKQPTDKNVVKAIKKLAKEADELVIATDFDREGELIGLEALEEMLDANPALGTREETADGTLQIQRARYSALTKEEIERAFNELDELSYPLANAGAARQDIDLLWGATLTRAVSLASRRFGSNFLSVGRVQSPTLGLIVEREMERRAHVAKPFWELFAKFEHPDGSFETHHSDRQILGEGRGRRGARRHLEPGHREVGDGAEEHPQAADPLQHHRLQHRRLQPPRHHPRQRDADRRGPLHGRLHLLPAHRQHGLPVLAAGARAGQLAGPDQGVLRRLRPARRRAETDPRQKRDDRPPADLPDPGRPPGRPRGPQEAGSTSSSSAASSPPSARR